MEKRKDNKMANIELNKQFYEKNAIYKAINDFKDISRFVLKEDKKSFILLFDERKDVPFLKEEFCNYILGLMKNKALI